MKVGTIPRTKSQQVLQEFYTTNTLLVALSLDIYSISVVLITRTVQRLRFVYSVN